ncbi:uncharacterized protein LOC108102306 isoform X2 [Drosophila eugracilis]|uniref:uncharacterized protein LOC108102306 isoform X2 n=1 Tax=Drosophila eugracilis TaxID=29029 RepID=UPI0007E87726|nr:uncharacterized protein LOC108102306 isoform X2 [Drosophila eugracilis]
MTEKPSVSDNDDELVDIETTEDEGKFISQQIHVSHTPADIVSESESTSLSPSTSTNIDVEGDVDVDVITTDAEDQTELNPNRCSIENTSHSLSIFQTEKIQISGSSLNSKSILDKEVKLSENAKRFNGHLKIIARRKTDKIQHDRSLSRLVNDKSLSNTSATKEISSSLQIQQRVAFPVFFKSHLHSFCPQSRQANFNPNSVTESHKWSCPVGSIGSVCCYETSVNENCANLK